MTHHLVGVTEIAELLQLSRQRADQLSRTKGLPDPVATLSGGRVWNAKDLEEWARRVKRHLCMPVGALCAQSVRAGPAGAPDR
jgi:prophage regulatory protein